MELVLIVNDKVQTTSRVIAETFEKEHKNVLRDIEALDCSEEFAALNFEPISYEDAYGRPQREYSITKDGFTFLAMGYRGEKAAKFKEAYIEAFNKMEQILLNQRNPVALELSWDNMQKLVNMGKEEHRLRLVAEEKRDEAIEQRVWISSKREATAMAKASVLTREVAQLRQLVAQNLVAEYDQEEGLKSLAAWRKDCEELALYQAAHDLSDSVLGKRIKAFVSAMGCEPCKIPCPRYGSVNGYYFDEIEAFLESNKITLA